jgi:hypothetical protein
LQPGARLSHPEQQQGEGPRKQEPRKKSTRCVDMLRQHLPARCRRQMGRSWCQIVDGAANRDSNRRGCHENDRIKNVEVSLFRHDRLIPPGGFQTIVSFVSSQIEARRSMRFGIRSGPGAIELLAGGLIPRFPRSDDEHKKHIAAALESDRPRPDELAKAPERRVEHEEYPSPCQETTKDLKPVSIELQSAAQDEDDPDRDDRSTGFSVPNCP